MSDWPDPGLLDVTFSSDDTAEETARKLEEVRRHTDIALANDLGRLAERLLRRKRLTDSPSSELAAELAETAHLMDCMGGGLRKLHDPEEGDDRTG